MGGFFGPTLDFDDFLARFMTPAMEEAGFSRAKRVYRLQRDGASVVIQARLFAPIPVVSFAVDWAATPAVLRDFLKETRPNWRPSMNMPAMIYARLRGASELCGKQPHEDTHFEFVDPRIELPPGYEDLVARTVTTDEFGPRFLEFLRTSAVPRWRAALTVKYMLTANEADMDLSHPGNPGLFNNAGRYGKPSAVKAILGVDTMPYDAAEAAIDRFTPPDDPIVPWLQERLAQRR